MSTTAAPRVAASPYAVSYPILYAISFCHLLNDMMLSLLPAIGLLAAFLPNLDRDRNALAAHLLKQDGKL